MNIDVNDIWLITDLHFGVRSNSLDWLDIQKDYYYNYFIPFLATHKKENDVLFILGDLFDNRQSLNLLIMNVAIDIFEQISQIMPVYIIVGNHDLYRKSSNDINSIKILKYMDNITVFQEPEMITLNNNKKLFIMPWRANAEEEKKCIDMDNSDYLFCHTDVSGFNYNRHIVCETGNTIDIFKKYRQVFSGHLHFRQKQDNIVVLGSPYQLTRGDMDNIKAIVKFNPSTNDIQFYENYYSPLFLKLKLEDILEMTLEKFEEKIFNNFVDIIFTVNTEYDFPFNKLLENVKGYRKINLISDIEQQNNVELMLSSEDLIEFNIKKIADAYIDKMNHSDKIKELIKTKIYNLYTQVANKNSLLDNDV